MKQIDISLFSCRQKNARARILSSAWDWILTNFKKECWKQIFLWQSRSLGTQLVAGVGNERQRSFLARKIIHVSHATALQTIF
jgi:hypothetical protein